MNILNLYQSKPVEIPKTWGKELVIINNDKYCGKILRYNSNSKSSAHYHCSKSETFYFVSGKFKLTVTHPETAEKTVLNMSPGCIFDIPCGVLHQVTCLEAGDIFEVSTPDDGKDNWRVEKSSAKI